MLKNVMNTIDSEAIKVYMWNKGQGHWQQWSMMKTASEKGK